MTAVLTKRPSLTKHEANYREAENPARSCGTCDMFLAATGRCTLVRGTISAEDTCDHWAPLERPTNRDAGVEANLRKPSPWIPIAGGPPWSKKPHVRVLVINTAGEILLLQRVDRPDQWEPVQGTVGKGDKSDPDVPHDETPYHAAVRELEEETGYGGPSVTWEKLSERTWLVRLPAGVGKPTIDTKEHLAYRWDPPAVADAWLARERFYGGFRKQATGEDDLADQIIQAAGIGDWDGLAQLVAPQLGEGAAEGALAALTETGQLHPETLSVAHAGATDWAATHAAELVQQIGESTRLRLRNIVADALEEGWSPQDLADAIAGTDEFDDSRAKMIARTELAAAHSQGALEGWRATDVVSGKRWLTAPDHAGDDDCDENAAVGTIGLDETFPSGHDGPPAHPNCRCVVVPVIAAAEEEQ